MRRRGHIMYSNHDQRPVFSELEKKKEKRLCQRGEETGEMQVKCFKFPIL
jgi:hypothetical protein